MQAEMSLLKAKVDDFILEEIDDEKADNTVKKYKHDILSFIDFFKDKEFISKKDVVAYKKTLENNGMKISTINSYIVIINKYLKYLEYDALKVQVLRVQRKTSVENVPTVATYKRFLRAAKKHNMLDAYYLIKLYTFSGIRVSETCYITIENLKSAKKDKCILVKNKGKYREIFIPKWLMRELLGYAKLMHIKSGPIFRSKKGPLHRSTIWKKIQKVAGYAKCNKLVAHPHAFRHLFGKEMMKQNNQDYRKLADYLGHNNPNTSQIYTQLTRAEKAQEIEEFKL